MATAEAKWPQSSVDLKFVNQDPNIFDVGTAPDGQGGVIAVYGDYTIASGRDIRAQRYDVHGNAVWEPGGIRVSQAIGHQDAFHVVPDPTGGCFVIWQDSRSGNIDIYGQRINAAGQYLWPTDGISLINLPLGVILRAATPDSLGGFLVSYTEGHLSAQRFNENGSPLWPGTGVLAHPVLGVTPTALIGDGAGGAVLGLHYAAGDLDVYAVHINNVGVRTDITNLTEPSVATQTGLQLARRADNTILCVWRDYREGTFYLYSTEYTPSTGTALPVRRLNHLNLPVNNFQLKPSNFGDPIIGLNQEVSATNYDIHVGRVLDNGLLAFSTSLADASGHQFLENLAESDSGLIRTTYFDYNSGSTDYRMYAAQFAPNGAFDWQTALTPVDTYLPNSMQGTLITGSQESMIALLREFPTMAPFEIRFPLVRVRADGTLGGEPVGAPANLRTTELQASRVSLAWDDTATNETEFIVMRSTTVPAAMVAIATLPANSTAYTDTNVEGNKTYHYSVAAVNALSEEMGLSPNLTVTTPPPGPELNFAPGNISMFAKKKKATIVGDLVIRNTGELPSAPTNLALFLSPSGSSTVGALQLFQLPVPALSPGQSIVVQPGLLPPKKPGKKQKARKIKLPKGVVVQGQFLVAEVDYGNLNPEPNEGNNIYSAGL